MSFQKDTLLSCFSLPDQCHTPARSLSKPPCTAAGIRPGILRCWAIRDPRALADLSCLWSSRRHRYYRVAQKYGDGIMSPERAPYLNWGKRGEKGGEGSPPPHIIRRSWIVPAGMFQCVHKGMAANVSSPLSSPAHHLSSLCSFHFPICSHFPCLCGES